MDEIKNRSYGWQPDLPDARDLMYRSFKPLLATVLPPLVDLRNQCPPIYDQGSLGSCTANALGAAYQFAQIKQKKPSKIPSRLFIYYNERALRNMVSVDSGATIRDGIKTMSVQGVAPEELWPYDINKFSKRPTSNVYDQAAKNKISTYTRIDNTKLALLKSCLADGFPFVFGFTVYNQFESEEMAKSPILALPSKEDRVLGGHAVIAVGYDDSKQAFIIRNSWGPRWGDKGYFYMPYEYITNSKLAADFWTIRFVTN